MLDAREMRAAKPSSAYSMSLAGHSSRRVTAVSTDTNSGGLHFACDFRPAAPSASVTILATAAPASSE